MRKKLSFLLVMLLILGAGAGVIFRFYLSPAQTVSQSLSGVEQATGYIINKRSQVFHSPDCPSTEQMAQSNKLFSEKSREELLAEGYSPCGICNP